MPGDADILITITKGIARVAAEEVRDITGVMPIQAENTLRVRLGVEAVPRLILWGRTIYKVIHVLDEGVFNSLEDIARRVESLDLRLFGGDGSFALRSSRYGSHGFTSLDANRVVGAAVYRALERAGYKVSVDLTSPDREYILRIVDDRYTFGVNLVGESLHIRGYRVWNHPAAIKTSLAAAMVLLSGFWDEPFIDPMAGGGTIPIEAALYRYRYAPGLYRPNHMITKIPYYPLETYLEAREEAYNARLPPGEGPEIIYNDISCRYMSGAERNAESAGVDRAIRFMCVDARDLTSHLPSLESGVAVFNPPYGIRMTRRKVLEDLYRDVVDELSSLGIRRIVAITSEYRLLRDALEASGYRVLENLQVLHGKLITRIAVAEA